jgi:hypothetical protein
MTHRPFKSNNNTLNFIQLNSSILFKMASSSTNTVKPIRKRRLNSPNDHIMILIKEWYNDAKANGTQTMNCYKKVLILTKYYLIFSINRFIF